MNKMPPDEALATEEKNGWILYSRYVNSFDAEPIFMINKSRDVIINFSLSADGSYKTEVTQIER